MNNKVANNKVANNKVANNKVGRVVPYNCSREKL